MRRIKKGSFLNKNTNRLKMKDKNKSKRLKKSEWDEIRVLLKNPDRDITAIAEKYGINRTSIYGKAWRNGWLEKKTKPKKKSWLRKWSRK